MELELLFASFKSVTIIESQPCMLWKVSAYTPLEVHTYLPVGEVYELQAEAETMLLVLLFTVKLMLITESQLSAFIKVSV